MLILALTPSSWACEPAPLVVAEAMGDVPSDARCVLVDIDTAGRLWASVPDVGLDRGVSLQRARAEAGLRFQDVQARLAMIAVRSGGATGYVGVDGEAIVPAIQIAEARWDWRDAGLAVAGGLVDDPWVMTVQGAWDRADVLLPLATDGGFLDRADTGGWASWTAPGRFASTTVAVTSGEGLARRERNVGTNVTGVLHVRPLALLDDPPVDLELAAFGREGSRGIGSAPDHRAGAAIIARHDLVVGGVDGLLGWGLRGDGALRPAGISVWARSGPEAPVSAVLRVDRRTDDLGQGGAGQGTLLLGAGPRLPLDGPAYLMVGWQGRTFGADARPIAGSEALTRSDLVFVQIGARLLAAEGL